MVIFMKIIIVGIGKLGEYLAKSLVKDKNDVTLIDLSFKRVQDVINNEDLNYIMGSGLNIDNLIEAGIKDTDLLISVMDKDEENVMCCLLAKKLGAKHTIARIRNQEYRESIDLIKDDLGLSMMINPEYLTASHIAQIVSIPSALDTTTFFKGRVQMLSLKISKDSNLNRKSINEINKSTDGNVIVCAIERDKETLIPMGATKLENDDRIHVIGTPSSLLSFIKYAGLIKKPIKEVMISGGSDTAIYLAKILCDMKIKVKLIESLPERCEYLTEVLPKALIINGDVSDQNLLLEEGIEDCDCFICLNSIDEENLVYSMFAKSINVPKIITKINHINLSNIIDLAKIDTVVTPHIIASNQIVSYVRAMSNTDSSSCESIYKFKDFEMIEFKIKDNFEYLNTKIKNLNIKNDIIISTILRGRNVIFPGGNDVIKKHDTLVIVVNNKSNIKDINDIME